MRPSLACLMLLLATTGAHAGTSTAATATPQKTTGTTTIAHRKLLEYSGPDSFQYATPSDFRYGGLKEAIRDSVVGIPTTPPSTNIPDDRFAAALERSPYGSRASGGGLRHLLNLLSYGNARVWRDTPQRDTVKLAYIQGSVPRGDNRMLVQQAKGPDSWVYAEPSDYQYGAAAQFYKDVVRSEVVAPQQNQQLSSARFEQPPPALRGDNRRLMASDDAAAMAADADEHAPASIKAGAGSSLRRLLDGRSGPDSWQYGTPDNYRYGGLNNFVKEAVRADVVGSAAAIPDSRFARQPGVVSDK